MNIYQEHGQNLNRITAMLNLWGRDGAERDELVALTGCIGWLDKALPGDDHARRVYGPTKVRIEAIWKTMSREQMLDAILACLDAEVKRLEAAHG